MRARSCRLAEGRGRLTAFRGIPGASGSRREEGFDGVDYVIRIGIGHLGMTSDIKRVLVEPRCHRMLS